MGYLIILILIFIVTVMFLLIIIHLDFWVPKNLEKTDPGREELEFQTVSIPTVSQKLLFGWLIPVEYSTTTVIILHGCGGNAEQMLPLATPFHQAGVNILFIDARNHGRSDRDSFSSFSKFAEDLEKAIQWLKSNYPEYSKKIILLGHSVGAGAVLLIASKRSDIDAVISISTFAHPRQLLQRFLKRFYTPSFLSSLIIHYREWIVKSNYDEIAPINTISHIQCPVLLVHGKIDTTVPVEDTLFISRKCKRPNIKVLIIENATHTSIEKIKVHKKELMQFLRDYCFSSTPLRNR